MSSHSHPIPPIMPPRRASGGRAARALCAAAVAASMALAACGGDTDEGTAVDATSTSEDSAALTMSVADFVPLYEDEKQATIEDVVAASPQCDGLHADRDFLITVSVRATDGPPDRPVARLIRDACTP